MTAHRVHIGHVLGISAFLTIPFAIFMSKALAPLFAIAAVCGLALFFFEKHSLPPLPRFYTAFFAAVIIWGLISSFWSIAPQDSLRLPLTLAGIFIGGLVLVSLAGRLNHDERRFLETALIIGGCLGFAVLAIEVFTPLALTRILRFLVKGQEVKVDYTYANFYKTGTTLASLMIWPAMAVLWKKGIKTGAVVLFAFALFVISKSSSGSSMLAITAAMATVAIALVFRKRAAWVFGILVTVNVSTMPLVAYYMPDAEKIEPFIINIPDVNKVSPLVVNVAESIYPRIFIWREAANYIKETPVLGKGLNSSRALSTIEDKVRFSKGAGSYGMSEPIPLHPHNTILQVWLEFGAVGAVMLLTLLLALINRINDCEDPIVRAVSYGAFITALATANVSYSIWSSWWQSALWLTAAFIAALLSRSSPEPA